MENYNGGKGNGLLEINEIEGTNVPEFTIIPANINNEEQENIIENFTSAINGRFDKVAVRSSALKEDSVTASFAGAFDTKLNVAANKHSINKEVNTIKNNGKIKLKKVFNHESDKSVAVVIQRMVENPDLAGVCLSIGYSKEENNYLLLNFREGLGEDLVSGHDSGTELRVLREGEFHKDTVKKFPFLPKLRENIKKIEKKFGNIPVDIEFAVKDGELFTLQARPFITENTLPKENNNVELNKLSQEINNIADNDILGDMIDINPRELLGHPVADINADLFKKMFADNIVEEARAEVGYAPLNKGLLKLINGKPYVSLRNSAYSLRPEGISEKIYDKMVEAYRQEVLETPSKQDKVEFEVFVTNAKQLPEFFKKHPKLFNNKEKKIINRSFLNVDKKLAETATSFCVGYRDQYDDFCEYTNFMDNYTHNIDKLSEDKTIDINEALEQLQEGTRFFVKTARLAFYKKALCDELYGEKTVLKSLTGLLTPSEKMRVNLLRYAKGDATKDELTKMYGHIRAGQMNIFADSYKDNIRKNLDLDSYDNLTNEEIEQKYTDILDEVNSARENVNSMPKKQKRDIMELRFLLTAREEVKHEFMRAYDLVAENLKVNPEVKEEYTKSSIIMPSVLSNETDIACINVPSNNGTYFTEETIEAAPVVVSEDNLKTLTKENVEGKVLVMDHADPGYDFLLLYNPAGVVTKIGGPASHIAIRVNEYKIPSCIGSGIDVNKVDESKTYILDCKNKQHYSSNTTIQQKSDNDNSVKGVKHDFH